VKGALVELADEWLAQPFVGIPLRQLPLAKSRADVHAQRHGGVEDVAEDRDAALAGNARTQPIRRRVSVAQEHFVRSA
jgi:hypothetical protein